VLNSSETTRLSTFTHSKHHRQPRCTKNVHAANFQQIGPDRVTGSIHTAGEMRTCLNTMAGGMSNLKIACSNDSLIKKANMNIGL
jgi:hypothetical protein